MNSAQDRRGREENEKLNYNNKKQIKHCERGEKRHSIFFCWFHVFGDLSMIFSL